MRVGLVTYALDRPLSGLSRYAVELARALRARAVDLDTVLLTAGGAGPLAAEGLPQVALPGCSRWPALFTWGSVVVPWAARRAGVDLIHDPSGATPFLFGAGAMGTVVTVHDTFAWSVPGHSTQIDTWLYRYWLPRLLPRVDAVISVSQASKADIVRYVGVPERKVHVTYEGVSPACRPLPAHETAAVAARLGWPDSYILFLGSVETRKNVRGLLRAYAHLRQMGETRPLLVAGIARGKVAPLEEMLQDLDLQRHVLLTGYVADEDLPALYSAADLFAFPSLYEGFGLPPLEAMACGAPVVCSNAGSLPEVVGDAALTVDPHDVEGLALAMRRVLQDAELAQELRRRGLQRARLFSWQKAARETVAVYEQVLSRRR